jgi:hypothetical protein
MVCVSVELVQESSRITPIELLISGAESQIFNVIDQTVEYDFPTSNIEVGLPKLSVQEIGRAHV